MSNDAALDTMSSMGTANHNAHDHDDSETHKDSEYDDDFNHWSYHSLPFLHAVPLLL